MIREYHRPAALDEALEMLARPGVATAVLGGGTELNGLPVATPDAVVDLQALGLNRIEAAGDRLAIGATATLRDVMDDARMPALLRDLARREAPNTLRNAATVGGAVASPHLESGFVAGLLVCDAVVTVVGRDGSHEVALAGLLADPAAITGRIVTAVSVEPRSGWFAATGRTPADTPIVLVVGTRDGAGSVCLAATGVGPTPIVIDPDSLDSLDPPADFRGSTEYRRHLVEVLARRVTERLEEAG
jgi:CO/xanthine dehydrogenase FAD-binding subunit